MVKLSAEILEFLTITGAFYVLFRSRSLFKPAIGHNTLGYVFLGITIVWAGFLVNVLNEFFPTKPMKVLDDILVAIGVMILLMALLEGESKMKARAVPRPIGSGDPTVLRGFYLYDETKGVENLLLGLGGRKVLAVTRKPDLLKERNVPYIWITKLNVENGVPPTKLAPLLQYIVDKADENTVVLIDCVEYLIIENEFKAAFKFMTTLKDHLSSKGATLILIINRKTIDKRELALLEKEFRWLPAKV
jgi:hypothetical protein